MYPRLLMHADSLFAFRWLYDAVRISECRLWLGRRIILDTKQCHKPPLTPPFQTTNVIPPNLHTRPPAKYRHDSNSPNSSGFRKGGGGVYFEECLALKFGAGFFIILAHPLYKM
jgi:hypothetical protein